MASSCYAVRQAVEAAVAYAFIDSAKTNFVGAITFGVTHTLYGSTMGPGLSLAFARRFGTRWKLLVEAGSTHATGDRGVVAPYGDSAFSVFGRLEPRIQLNPLLAIAPFFAFTALLASSNGYAAPLGVRALFSPTSRIDLGLQLEASDLTGSSTLVRYSVDVAGYFAARL